MLNTLTVHVESCLDVVQRIRDEILTVPKLVVEDILCGWHDLDFLRIDLDVRVVPVIERVSMYRLCRQGGNTNKTCGDARILVLRIRTHTTY